MHYFSVKSFKQDIFNSSRRALQLASFLFFVSYIYLLTISGNGIIVDKRGGREREHLVKVVMEAPKEVITMGIIYI